MTQRLYYEDAYIRSFTARVISCEREGDRFALILDRTAFFPGGGGQQPDGGTAGGAEVLGMAEAVGEIIHYVNQQFAPGSEISCELDWPVRFRRMQNHSGEHIISGVAHALFGYDNVGFHMEENFVTIDLGGPLTKEQLELLERTANEAVFRNVEVSCRFPASEELAALDYRSKLDLEDGVRIVEVAGVDRCACCAPHVKRSGEIGIIKILTAERHRGGMRLTAACGFDAYEDYRRKSESVAAISGALSAKQDAVFPAVQRVLAEIEDMKKERYDLRRRLLEYRIERLEPSGGNILLFERDPDPDSLRALVNAGKELCPGICAVFAGDDEKGYRYVMGSRSVDMKARAAEINAAVSGRGGGSREMISGTASAPRRVIEEYFAAGP
mgnify:FL=1